MAVTLSGCFLSSSWTFFAAWHGVESCWNMHEFPPNHIYESVASNMSLAPRCIFCIHSAFSNEQPIGAMY